MNLPTVVIILFNQMMVVNLIDVKDVTDMSDDDDDDIVDRVDLDRVSAPESGYSTRSRSSPVFPMRLQKLVVQKFLVVIKDSYRQ